MLRHIERRNSHLTDTYQSDLDDLIEDEESKSLCEDELDWTVEKFKSKLSRIDSMPRQSTGMLPFRQKDSGVRGEQFGSTLGAQLVVPQVKATLRKQRTF